MEGPLLEGAPIRFTADMVKLLLVELNEIDREVVDNFMNQGLPAGLMDQIGGVTVDPTQVDADALQVVCNFRMAVFFFHLSSRQHRLDGVERALAKALDQRHVSMNIVSRHDSFALR